MNRLFLALSMVVVVTLSSASAAVTLDFATGVHGFVANTVASPGSTVAHSTDFGGSMRITTPGGSDTFSSSLRAVVLDFTLGDPFQVELANAQANGGTLSFDFHIREADQVLAGTAPGLVEAAILTDGSFLDRSIGLVGYPGAGATQSRTFSFDIMDGTGWDFNATNSNLIYSDDGTGSFAFGIKDSGGAFDTATFYVDNLTVAAVAAVPEPSSFGLLAVAGIAMVSRRRKAK